MKDNDDNEGEHNSIMKAVIKTVIANNMKMLRKVKRYAPKYYWMSITAVLLTSAEDSPRSILKCSIFRSSIMRTRSAHGKAYNNSG